MNLCVNGITLHYEIFGEGRPIAANAARLNLESRANIVNCLFENVLDAY